MRNTKLDVLSTNKIQKLLRQVSLKSYLKLFKERWQCFKDAFHLPGAFASWTDYVLYLPFASVVGIE